MTNAWVTVKTIRTMAREVRLDTENILLQRIEEDGCRVTVESKAVEDCEIMAKNRKSYWGTSNK